MGKYTWHGAMWSTTGCPGEYHNLGWWTSDGITFVIADYRNSATGKPYTDAELDKIQGVVIPPIVIPPTKPANAASVWILGVIVLVLAAGIVWFVTK